VVTSVLEMEEWHQRYRLRPRRRNISDALGEFWGQVVYFSLLWSLSPISALHVTFFLRDFRVPGILRVISSTWYRSGVANLETPSTINLRSPYTSVLQTLFQTCSGMLCPALDAYRLTALG